jgi:hypothetical protein
VPGLGSFLLFVARDAGVRAPVSTKAAPRLGGGRRLALVPPDPSPLGTPRLNGGHIVAPAPAPSGSPRTVGPAGLGGALILTRAWPKLVPPPTTIVETAAKNRGAATSTLGGLTSAATGVFTFVWIGTIAANLGGLQSSANGSLTFSGSIAATLLGLRSAATGAETFAGSITQRLLGLRSAGLGSEVFSGTIASSLLGLRSAAAGSETFVGTVAQRLLGLRSAGVGGLQFTAAIASRLLALRSVATGAEVFSGTASQQLLGLRSAGIGTNGSASVYAPPMVPIYTRTATYLGRAKYKNGVQLRAIKAYEFKGTTPKYFTARGVLVGGKRLMVPAETVGGGPGPSP